ncbi:ATP-binding protein [Nonomuraea sp. NPDC050790]|uniref:ATP-binding protein n=1 Tax=Nonomuraea sp. NPDC050790 TaxID=3364371 RepID=UPI0037BD8719
METLTAPEGATIASWSLPSHFRAAAEARRHTAGYLNRWGFHDTDTSVLLVSELVTNALRYAPGPVTLTVWLIDGLLRCEVEDTSAQPPAWHEPAVHAEGHRGLFLLDALACCWGFVRTGEGKAVWFELPVAGEHDA